MDKKIVKDVTDDVRDMLQEGSLPHSQIPVTCPYPETDPSSPCSHIPLHEDPS